MSDVKSIKDQKLLYHLTSVENLDGIFKEGLKPRAGLSGFKDVADVDILKKRQVLQLDHYVPFHWFAKNPFDGSVQRSRPDTQFVLISVYRSIAKQNGWKVIPRHPLAGDSIQLLEYEKGFEAIEWDVMSSREYLDPHCKSICMAECLAPGVVKPEIFFNIFTPSEEVEALCLAKLKAADVNVQTSVNQRMFY
ncbi:DarT ssDNA thymidine ADP-ribosyltransferase family protein [Pseudomonas sp. FP2196]|uniref:DarT ssDNA thymidine ADP-ribosyltransferase family protein n=1 Tax=Pseudomonas sp. FP2196 TaxID=2954086 RepID=UPI0027335E65|nr:DarT ssDNA thymidine ADP-ribosyltransferase family protein [Pseudomonas sp. FP2196]WLH35014.1 DarT ssDNA thymidine ADP-ribosyltransferase family protein [Pseudomonas sp. FP2196]